MTIDSYYWSTTVSILGAGALLVSNVLLLWVLTRGKVGVAENVDQASCLAVQGLRIYGDADSTFVHLIVRSFFSFRIGGLRKGCVSPTKLLTATTGGI